jgi:hypothetical protein
VALAACAPSVPSATPPSGATPTPVVSLSPADAIGQIRTAIAAEAAAHPDEFCGSYIDLDQARAFTSRWRAGLEAHEAAIRARLSPDANLAFKSCSFTLAALDGLRDRIAADAAWLDSLKARLVEARTDVRENAVVVSVATYGTDVREQIAGRQAVPPAMVRVEVVGTGAMFVPWGGLDVTVIGPDGKIDPAADRYDGVLHLRGTSTPPGLSLGGGALEAPFDATPCQAGDWAIEVIAEIAENDHVSLGSAEVHVDAGATTPVTIEIGPVPTRRPG